MDARWVRRIGPYELVERIGIGGMAEVFRASQSGEEGFQRTVAVKRILPSLCADPDFVRMFIDEAKIAVQLQHPNIAQVYDLGRDDDVLFIALEYVDGRDMGAITTRQREHHGRPLPLSFVVQVAMKICEALTHAHNAMGSYGQPLDLIHRDISPQNILVSFEGAVKVVDFGLAKAAGRTVQTQAGVVKGKLAYLSAEQARGETIDSRSDLFSLGTCLFEWLTDERLFLRRNDPDTVIAVQRAEVPPLRAIRPELPQALDHIVRRALRADPNERFATAGEFHDALRSFAIDAGMPVKRRRLVEVLHELWPESSGVIVSTPGGGRAEAPSIPGVGDDEPTEDRGPRDTIPAPPASMEGHGAAHPSQGPYEDLTSELPDARDAVMQVLATPSDAELDAHPFEDEVSAVPVVESDSSARRRPATPAGRTPLADESLADESLAGESLADESLAHESLAHESLADEDVLVDTHDLRRPATRASSQGSTALNPAADGLAKVAHARSPFADQATRARPRRRGKTDGPPRVPRAAAPLPPAATDLLPGDPPPREPLAEIPTGDFSRRAEILASNTEARRQRLSSSSSSSSSSSFDDTTTAYPPDVVEQALRKSGPVLEDESTAMYSPEAMRELLSKAAVLKPSDELTFTDETIDERPSDEFDRLLEELEPLEGEATRTDGATDE